MPFHYHAQKLSLARRCLMLPHPHGEERSIADAFHACAKAFKDIATPENEKHLDDNAKDWISVISALMSTDGLTDGGSTDLWFAKAKTLSTDDKIQLSRCVNELADWFDSMND